jgi:hypothetical protein
MPQDFVFVLIGQSNMVGWTESKFSELPDWLKQKPVQVEFYQQGRQMEFHQQAGGRIGPEVSFGKYLAAWYPGRKIRIVKLAVGGTSIYDWARLWNPRLAFRMTESTIQSSLYTLLRKQIDASAVLTLGNTVNSFLWMQGERDARYPLAANAYLGNLKTFINDLRREYASPNAAFVLGRINPPKAQHPAVDVIRKAQEVVTTQMPRTVWVNTDELSKAADQIHYDTNGEVALGRSFAYAVRRFYPVPS